MAIVARGNCCLQAHLSSIQPKHFKVDVKPMGSSGLICH